MMALQTSLIWDKKPGSIHNCELKALYFKYTQIHMHLLYVNNIILKKRGKLDTFCLVFWNDFNQMNNIPHAE